MKKNDWVEKYNKYADENFDFNKLVDAYQIMSDEYYDLAVYFYKTWEDKTTEEVLFPSSEKGFLQKASYNNYKRLVNLPFHGAKIYPT